MPELPWIKWYPTNWASEPGLKLCEAATRGIWFEAINTMMLQGTDHITGTLDQLSSLCICRNPQMSLAISQLKQFKVANITEHNGNITLTNRKRLRECSIKELRRKAGIISGTKRQHHPQHDVRTNTPTPSAYAYASISVSKGTGVQEGSTEGSQSNGTFDALKSALVILFARNPNQQLSHLEESSLLEVSKRETVMDEFERIKNLYESTPTKDRKFLPSLSSLLSDWGRTLDRAQFQVQSSESPEVRRIRNI